MMKLIRAKSWLFAPHEELLAGKARVKRQNIWASNCVVHLLVPVRQQAFSASQTLWGVLRHLQAA